MMLLGMLALCWTCLEVRHEYIPNTPSEDGESIFFHTGQELGDTFTYWLLDGIG